MASRNPARVVVVDGYDESREALARELRRAGHEVTAVAEEDEAIAALEVQPDVVLLDLPIGETGEAARAIRKANAELVIVAVIDPSAPLSARDAARREGIDYFFLRPCPPTEVVKQLRRLRRT